MKIIPYRRIRIETHLSIEGAIELLRMNLFMKNPPFLYKRGSFDFYGRIRGSRFTAHRLLDYRGNAFIPMIHGCFVQTSVDTEIHITMHPPIINLILASPLICMPFVIFFKSLKQQEPFLQNLGLLAIPVLIYGFMLGMFTPEANRAESFLTKVFNDTLGGQWEK
jgi:hypothetical protein